MTPRITAGSVVSVTLPAWIVQDGAERVPSVGDTVDYALEFGLVRADRESTFALEAPAVAEPIGDSPRDGRFLTLLHFGPFDAVGYLPSPDSHDGIRDETTYRVHLAVDYEIIRRVENRCTGTVARRRLVTQVKEAPDADVTTSLTDLAADAPRGFRDTSLPTTVIEADGNWTKHPAPDTWQRDIGLLLDIELA